MASIQSVGAVRPGGDTGMGDILVKMLEAGILGNNEYTTAQENKKKGNDDLIKTGIASKSMRPAKDGEKSDFKDSSGRGWVYDDSSLKEENKQRDEMRKTQAWDSVNARAQVAAAESERNNPGSYWQTYNRTLATMVGHPDGKMSDDEVKAIGDRYGDSATSYFNNFQSSGNKNVNPTGVTSSPAQFLNQANNIAALTNAKPNASMMPLSGQSVMNMAPSAGGAIGGILPHLQGAGAGAAQASGLDPNILMHIMNLAQQGGFQAGGQVGGMMPQVGPGIASGAQQ